jgi:RNA polymerase sigma-70 factor, ECF subfamily
MPDPLQETAGIESLLAKARTGDRDAEDVLFSHLHARLLAVAKRRVFDGEAARDLVQETLQTACEKYRNADLSNGLLPWVFAIFRHKVGNYLKRRRTSQRWIERAPDDLEALGGSPAGEMGAIELAASLEGGLRQASAECRRVFELLLAGADREEIRAAFGNLPIGTIDSRISRCRAALLAYLEGRTGKGVRH